MRKEKKMDLLSRLVRQARGAAAPFVPIGKKGTFYPGCQTRAAWRYRLGNPLFPNRGNIDVL